MNFSVFRLQQRTVFHFRHRHRHINILPELFKLLNASTSKLEYMDNKTDCFSEIIFKYLCMRKSHKNRKSTQYFNTLNVFSRCDYVSDYNEFFFLRYEIRQMAATFINTCQYNRHQKKFFFVNPNVVGISLQKLAHRKCQRRKI